MRYIRSYRYILTNKLENMTYYCSSWKDIQAQTGISRGSMYMMLNNQYVDKFSNWDILRCNIKKDSSIQQTLF